MTSPTPDLDERLRRLGAPTDRADLSARTTAIHARAARRRARRRTALAAGVVPVLVLLAVAASALVRDDDRVGVSTGPPATTDPSPPTTPNPGESRSLGTLEGLSIAATPSTELIDGQQIQVSIDGLDLLQSPLLVLCAGDLTAENATDRCDLATLDRAGDDPANPIGLQPEMTVTVRQVITLPGATDDDPTTPYDCARAPDGCVLAIGQQTLPTRGAFVPLHFRANPARRTPQLTIEPATGLRADEPITVRASGLRPNSSYGLRQCSMSDPIACDEVAWPGAKTDAEGDLETELPARPALYGHTGRVDCTVRRCQITVTDESYGAALAHAELAFAPGVAAPEPALSIVEPGPYVDDQTVTVRGTGFPAGADVGGHIGQCPDGKDTAVEERCTYPVISETLVADDGTFEMAVRIQASLLYTGPCDGEVGCHLGWVLNHGPTIAKLPLDVAS